MARSPEERSSTGEQGSGVLAVRLHDDGLKVEEIETPSPDPGEVLVRVHAAAITRDELEWPVDGGYPACVRCSGRAARRVHVALRGTSRLASSCRSCARSRT